MRVLFITLFLSVCGICTAQNDTTQKHGTIKVGKQKTSGEFYVKAVAKFTEFNTEKVAGRRHTLFQPFPVVDGYAYPFNYSKYYKDCFKHGVVDLNGKTRDTVMLAIHVSKKGKVTVTDNTQQNTENGKPPEYNSLYSDCVNYTKAIRKWFPAYAEFSRTGKFKSQTVIKPEKMNLESWGFIMIIFSTEPFDE